MNKIVLFFANQVIKLRTLKQQLSGSKEEMKGIRSMIIQEQDNRKIAKLRKHIETIEPKKQL